MKNMEQKKGRSCEVRGGYKVGLWKAIKKDSDTFYSRVSLIMGHGRSVKFW